MENSALFTQLQDSLTYNLLLQDKLFLTGCAVGFSSADDSGYHFAACLKRA